MEPYKILLVEDSDDIRLLIAEMLEDEGYLCLQACHGLEAKKILENQKINLMITDYRMPEMDGVELLSWCREAELRFPVIFITANSDVLPKELISLKGCAATVIKKPMEITALLFAIDEFKLNPGKKE